MSLYGPLHPPLAVSDPPPSPVFSLAVCLYPSPSLSPPLSLSLSFSTSLSPSSPPPPALHPPPTPPHPLNIQWMVRLAAKKRSSTRARGRTPQTPALSGREQLLRSGNFGKWQLLRSCNFWQVGDPKAVQHPRTGTVALWMILSLSVNGTRCPLLLKRVFIDNLLVRIHFIIVMIRWTDLAPCEFEFPFPGSLTSTFLVGAHSINWLTLNWSES